MQLLEKLQFIVIIALFKSTDSNPLFDSCLIQSTINLHTLETDLDLQSKLLQTLTNSLRILLTTNTFELNDSISPRQWKYSDNTKYPYSQRRFSPCFLKFYYLSPSPSSQVQRSWRNIFYTERSLANLNRVPDSIFIFTPSDPPAGGLEPPWKFLLGSQATGQIVNFMTPTKIFMQTPTKLLVICIHCIYNSQVIEITKSVEAGEEPFDRFHQLSSAWKSVHKNLHGHYVFASFSLEQNYCSLRNMEHRRKSTGSFCIISESSLLNNFTHPRRSNPARSLISLTREGIYDFRTQLDWSYKQMRERLTRFDEISVSHESDRFTFAVVDWDGNINSINILYAMKNTFQWRVWASILATAGLLIAFMFAMYHNICKGSSFLLFQTLVLLVFASAVDQSQPAFLRVTSRYKRNGSAMRKLNAVRVLLLFWLMLTFACTNMYKSLLFAVWIIPPDFPIPKTVGALLKSGLKIVTTEKDGIALLYEHIQSVKPDLDQMVRSELSNLVDSLTSLDGTEEESSLIDILGRFRPAGGFLIPLLFEESEDNVVRNVSLVKFAIFDTTERLDKFKTFVATNFPTLAIRVNPNVHNDLGRIFNWTCARTFFYEILQFVAMSLNQGGFYRKWQEYYGKFKDKMERAEFKEKYGNYNGQGLGKQDSIFGMNAFQRFIILYSGQVAICFCSFMAEIYLNYRNTKMQLIYLR